jgi:hypothetical protein
MEKHFTLTSPAFEGGQRIPARYTCEGRNQPPRLDWSDAPEGTRSFALIMEDPDAPRGTFTHWVAYDIPVSEASIGGDESLAGVSGQNDFHTESYGGPCPPPNHGPHRYYITVYALDADSLGLPAGASRRQVEQAMASHILAQDTLMGRFERR